MEHLLVAVIGTLVIILCVLAGKLFLLRAAAREITDAFHDRLESDTNTLITLPCRDAHMCRLAAAINRELRLLRSQRHRYMRGDRELKEAVTNISHDLRTPLTAICGYLDLLEREELSENAARYIALIRGRTDAMKQLTQDLFRYSVILSAETPALEPVHVNAVLEESIAGFYAALTQRGIQPGVRLTERRVERTLNREALGRVFGNILSNALAYSDGDLDISLTDDCRICFSNTARELDPVQVGRLFDRFFTLETARSTHGLGLSIARTLTEQMGGIITAEYRDKRLSILLFFPEPRTE